MEPFLILGAFVVGCCIVSIKLERRRKEELIATFTNKILKDLANRLAPSPKYSEAGRHAAHSVFELLSTKCHKYGLKIGRTVIAGSMGKGTGIGYEDRVGYTINLKNSDFDCVVFINDMEPPFDNILEHFADILRSHHPNVRNDTIRTTEITVQFTYRDKTVGDINFDLLPAPNYVKQTDKQSLRGQEVGKLEARRSLASLQGKQIRSLIKDHDWDHHANRLYSSSFAEITVEYVKELVSNANVLNVVRLAKFWNAKLTMEEYVPARSYMVELIAIYCQLEAIEINSDVSTLDGFRMFLEAMSTFSKLSFSLHGKVHKVFGKTSPVIIDLANQYNNLAERTSQEAVNVFESAAKKTKKKLDKIKQNTVSESEILEIMKDIFLPKGSNKNSLQSVVVH